MTQGIYGIHNLVSDKWYVGQSINVEKRWVDHRTKLNALIRNPTSCTNPHLYNAWKHYGEGCFEFVLLEEILYVALLTAKEELWLVEKRNCSKGVYNKRIVVDSNKGLRVRAKLTEDAVGVIKRRISNGESCRRLAEEYGVLPAAMYDIRDGRTWKGVEAANALSVEVKPYIRAAAWNKGKQGLLSAEQRQRLSALNKGRKVHSEAYKNRLREESLIRPRNSKGQFIPTKEMVNNG